MILHLLFVLCVGEIIQPLNLSSSADRLLTGPDEAISKHIHALTPFSFFIIHNSTELISSFRGCQMGCVTCLKYLQLLFKIQQGQVEEFSFETC